MRSVFFYTVSPITRFIAPEFLRRLAGQKLILPFYHAVSDQTLRHIDGLYRVKTSKEFLRDLEFLLKYYSPIDLHQLVKIVNGEQELKRPSFFLSFDDGLRQFYDTVAPILLRKGVAATCFLNSDFIDNRDLFFRYKASLLIDRLGENPSLKSALTEYFPEKGDVKRQLLNFCYSDRTQIDLIARAIGLSFDDYLKRETPYLTADQIGELMGQGFQFGAHSKDHPEYRFLSLDEQLEQTTESCADICDRFNLPYRVFSFPFTDFGVSKAYFQKIFDQKSVELSFGCAGQRIEAIPQHLQRIPFESNSLSGRQILGGELLYFALKQPFGWNNIKRQ